MKCLVAALLLLALAGRTPAATCIVNSALDADCADPSACDDGGGHCTLRCALTATNNAGCDHIVGMSGTFSPATALPALGAGATLTCVAGMVIDGANTLTTGLVLSDHSTVVGCEVENVTGTNSGDSAIEMADVSGAVVRGCYVHDNYHGITANYVSVTSGDPVIIGGPNPGDGNVVNNGTDFCLGVRGHVDPGHGPVVEGNVVGTDLGVTTALPCYGGIAVLTDNAVVEHNVVNANVGDGIHVQPTVENVTLTDNDVGTTYCDGAHQINDEGVGTIASGNVEGDCSPKACCYVTDDVSFACFDNVNLPTLSGQPGITIWDANGCANLASGSGTTLVTQFANNCSVPGDVNSNCAAAPANPTPTPTPTSGGAKHNHGPAWCQPGGPMLGCP